MAWADRTIVVSAAVLVPSVRVLLRVIGIRRLYSGMSRLLPVARAMANGHDESARARVEEIARLVDAASRHAIVSSTCLHRSLILWWLLRRRRFAAVLQFGARKRDGRFEAHAWVEYGGTVIGDAAAAGDYTAVPLVPLENDA